jgi:hypothetical protein
MDGFCVGTNRGSWGYYVRGIKSVHEGVGRGVHTGIAIALCICLGWHEHRVAPYDNGTAAC